LSQPTRVSILGATGYGGGELLRHFIRTPDVVIAHATSRSQAGTPIGAVHRNLDGLTAIKFSDPSREQLLAESDVIIGALPHGASAETLAPLVDGGARVIDLSGDFRLRDAGEYQQWYDHVHPRPDLLAMAVYGCPEVNRDAIRTARLVASPGCFATSINLAILPAAAAGALCGTLTVTAITGSSGSGAEAKPGTHHPTRAETVRPYKVLDHQHVPEITQLARAVGSPAVAAIDFTPLSGPYVRGILAVVTADLSAKWTSAEVADLYRQFYAASPFVKVVAKREPEVATIAGTNYAEVRARITPDGRLHAICAIDNLMKGGAGQGLQCFNIMTGRAETACGLDHPGMWP
jgi:N-acetyl-gamma-glutamyl-phosphate reductase